MGAIEEEAGEEYSLALRRVAHVGTVEGVEELLLRTNDGTLEVRFHPTATEAAAVVWVGGAGGGLDGPAGGLYLRLASQLVEHGVASFRLHYRYPNQLLSCVMDTLLGTAYLEALGYSGIVLVGHSFGGAVVISAGSLSEAVVGVVAMSSQTYGTDAVSELNRRPLLLLHGTADEILPDACSRDIYRRAEQPKDIILCPGCRHGLDECRDQVDQDVVKWILKTFEREQ